LRYARVALREACPQRGEHCQFFAPEQLERLRDRVWMAAEIEQAIEQERVVLHYQPQYAINTQQVVGVEALVRLQGTNGDLIAPNQFIELAEETGLIVPLGRQVLEEACQQLARWRRAGYRPLRMAVNVSPRQLIETDFIDIVDHAVTRAGIHHTDLELEITERQVVEHMAEVEQTLRTLTNRGVRIAIDDFGTGYSSLSYLKTLPIDSLKIDRGFISDICSDENDQKIVQTLITMAHSMSMKVVAEGIEDNAQLELLGEYGVDEIQGYLLSKPVDAQALEAILRNPLPQLGAPANVVQLRP